MILSGQNFANLANYKFAETVKDNILGRKEIIYPLNINILDNDDIIYCKTDYINVLFNLIRDLDTPVNLITSESDYEINQEIFNLKPKCIKKWYAINVNYGHEDLIPIPLGIANDYCNTTLKPQEVDLNLQKNKKLLYINHRIETNRKIREPLYQQYENNNWCTVDYPNLSLEDFKNQLQKHNFILCPRGNGIDTHRLWESLYFGIIPVVQKHITHKNLDGLPILFVDSFEQVTEDFLISSLESLKFKNLEKLNINWWEDYIKNK